MPWREALLASLLLAAWVGATPGVAQQPAAGFDQEGYERAISTILCDCGCHPQSVKACACGRAGEMRQEIAGMIRGGPDRPPMTGDEVIDWYVAEYGEDIRIAPTARGFNLVAWLGPLVGLLVLTLLMVVVVRRMASRQAEPAVASGPASAAGDEAYRRRLRHALEKLD